VDSAPFLFDNLIIEGGIDERNDESAAATMAAHPAIAAGSPRRDRRDHVLRAGHQQQFHGPGGGQQMVAAGRGHRLVGCGLCHLQLACPPDRTPAGHRTRAARHRQGIGDRPANRRQPLHRQRPRPDDDRHLQDPGGSIRSATCCRRLPWRLALPCSRSFCSAACCSAACCSALSRNGWAAEARWSSRRRSSASST